MKNFALIGAAGFVAERHMKAIKETGNSLSVAYDIFDVMGKIDQYFPNSDFFLDFKNFEDFINTQRKVNESLEYISICTPNYLHKKQITFALQNNAHAICEKPLVLYPKDIEYLRKIEKKTDRRVYNILQLRLHPSIVKLKQQVEVNNMQVHDIDLTYITSRGKWYKKSWKANNEKSGGIITNIGIHFFDMLCWVFGNVKKNVVHVNQHNKAAGFLALENANVRWFLSLDFKDLPIESNPNEIRTYRSITIDEKEIDFSSDFANLHTKVYKEILDNNSFGLSEAETSVHLTNEIRNLKPIGLKSDFHPFLKKINI